MADKKNDIVTKYLADMAALEGHIYQAIDKQVKETKDEPDVNPILRNIRDRLEEHVSSLRKRIDALGGQSTSPVKEAGASILGIARAWSTSFALKRSLRTSAMTTRP